MFGPFKLKSTLSRIHNVDFIDVLKTKQALQSLNYYKPPKHGLTQYPEHDMFKGIERFQADNGLQKDGVMRPDGPTAQRLGETLAKQGKGRKLNYPADPGDKMPIKKPPKIDPNMPEINKPFFPDYSKSDPFVDEHGNIILEGKNPKNGLYVRPPEWVVCSPPKADIIHGNVEYSFTRNETVRKRKCGFHSF